MSPSDTREAARYRQEVLAAYRHWLAFLEAQQALLAVSGADADAIDPFEGANADQARAADARRRLAALPADQVALFEAVVAQERGRVQQRRDAETPARGGAATRADPDEVARLALGRLAEDARGLRRDDRRGLLPRGTPDEVSWLAIDRAAVEQAPPSAADYQLVRAGRGGRRGLILNGVAAALIIGAILALTSLLRPASSAPGPAAAVVTSAGAALEPWPIRAARDGAGTWTTAIVTSTARWDAACTDPAAPVGCWRAGSFRPIQLCLPAAQIATLATLQLDAPDGLPARTFAPVAPGDAEADLVIAACDRDAPPWRGRLRDVTPPPSHAPGEPTAEAWMVTAITASGRGADPALPEGQMVLLVTLADPDGADWVARAPTIRLADGSRALPNETTRADGATHLRYLIPEQPAPFTVVWEAATEAGARIRYRAELAPPAARDAVLRASLAVGDLAVQPAQQTMAVTLTLHNTGPAPLTLTAADLSFQPATGRQPVAAPDLAAALAPGERRTLTLTLPRERGTLQIGPFRYQLAEGG